MRFYFKHKYIKIQYFLILKKPAKYGKITLIQRHIREDYRMLAGPRNISGLTYNLIKNILSQDNEHVKLKKILNKNISLLFF